MAYAWKIEYGRKIEGGHDVRDEIIFKRHECQWILPYALADHLKYNPRHLPVVDILPNIKDDSVSLWEVGVDYKFKRIFAMGRTNEEYYLRLSIDRINRGFSASTPLPPPISFTTLPQIRK